MADAPEIVMLITRAEVIRRLGCSKDWLDQHATRLRRDHGFPAPALGRLYDPRDVAAWQQRIRDANAVRQQPPAGPPPANDDEDAEIRAAQKAMDQLAAGGPVRRSLGEGG